MEAKRVKTKEELNEELYYVAVEDCRTGMFMTYRYPLGKKIPTEMELDTDTFLDDMAEETYLLRHPL